jgi:hypothetical protein
MSKLLRRCQTYNELVEKKGERDSTDAGKPLARTVSSVNTRIELIKSKSETPLN